MCIPARIIIILCVRVIGKYLLPSFILDSIVVNNAPRSILYRKHAGWSYVKNVEKSTPYHPAA